MCPRAGCCSISAAATGKSTTPRYINLDYSDYAEPDLIGDATQLPLRDGVVDAVYSSGVFEHLRDPLGAGAEVARVLKPGGKAVIDWAFMQPIHAEGLHFYNATPWGVELAFRGLKLKAYLVLDLVRLSRALGRLGVWTSSAASRPRRSRPSARHSAAGTS